MARERESERAGEKDRKRGSERESRHLLARIRASAPLPIQRSAPRPDARNLLHYSPAQSRMINKSMSLEYEPSSGTASHSCEVVVLGRDPHDLIAGGVLFTASERKWHKEDSQGQIVSLVLRHQSLKKMSGSLLARERNTNSPYRPRFDLIGKEFQSQSFWQ
jgi:hypothetical protein